MHASAWESHGAPVPLSARLISSRPPSRRRLALKLSTMSARAGRARAPASATPMEKFHDAMDAKVNIRVQLRRGVNSLQA